MPARIGLEHDAVPSDRAPHVFREGQRDRAELHQGMPIARPRRGAGLSGGMGTNKIPQEPKPLLLIRQH